MNNLVIAIGGSGSNIASFIKKQNNPLLDIFIIYDKKQIKQINFDKTKSVFTISALGGDSSQNITSLVTQKAKENEINVKNIIVLPFSIETNNDNANEELIKLQSINQNIELYPNDSIAEDKNISMFQMMQLMDEKIYDRVSRENQISWKSFFIEQIKNDTVYKAYVQYWSKDYKVVLISPEFKTLDILHMPYMAPSKFTLKSECSQSCINIEEVATQCLEKYVLEKICE